MYGYKKGGRPKLNDSEKRSKRITLRYDQEEYDEIKSKLEDSRYRTLSDMLREIVINGRYVHQVENKTEIKLMMFLGKFSVNLNQIAKVLNSISNPTQIQLETIETLNKIFDILDNHIFDKK